jgi:hypothetical protein
VPASDICPASHPARLLARLAVVPLLAVTALLATGWDSASSATASGTTAPQTASSSRAMWVWDVSTPAATVALAQQAGVGQLFVAVPPRLPSSSVLPQVREISQRAAAAGIRVDALGGDPGWVDNPAWVVDNWLKPAMGTGLFTGVHVDIEPYTTSAWQTDRAGVVQRYLGTLDTLVAAAGPAAVEADIPFWLHEVPAGSSTLDREILRRVAGVSVMAYRDTAAGDDGTIALATPSVTAATDLGKHARVGQETNDLGDDPVARKQTFHGQTRTELEDQVAQVGAAFVGQPGYAGVVLHDAVGYAALAP